AAAAVRRARAGRGARPSRHCGPPPRGHRERGRARAGGRAAHVPGLAACRPGRLRLACREADHREAAREPARSRPRVGDAPDALQAFLKPGVADRLRERYPDLFASDDLRFTQLSGSGRLAGGRIRSDDLVLAAPSYEARGEGSLGLDGDLDATLQLVASPALT